MDTILVYIDVVTGKRRCHQNPIVSTIEALQRLYLSDDEVREMVNVIYETKIESGCFRLDRVWLCYHLMKQTTMLHQLRREIFEKIAQEVEKIDSYLNGNVESAKRAIHLMNFLAGLLKTMYEQDEVYDEHWSVTCYLVGTLLKVATMIVEHPTDYNTYYLLFALDKIDDLLNIVLTLNDDDEERSMFSLLEDQLLKLSNPDECDLHFKNSTKAYLVRFRNLRKRVSN